MCTVLPNNSADITGRHCLGEDFVTTCRRLGLEDDLSKRRIWLATARDFARNVCTKCANFRAKMRRLRCHYTVHSALC